MTVLSEAPRLYRVVRPFSGPHGEYAVGTLIDPRDWDFGGDADHNLQRAYARAAQLVSRRYLAEAVVVTADGDPVRRGPGRPPKQQPTE